MNGSSKVLCPRFSTKCSHEGGPLSLFLYLDISAASGSTEQLERLDALSLPTQSINQSINQYPAKPEIFPYVG